MRPMNAFETVIYNEGERLIPWVTHSVDELVRHRSSYEFFKAVIEQDLKARPQKTKVTIVDLGFGTGHGCKLLSEIPGAEVTGIDNSADCKAFAERHYAAPNITYRVGDIPAFLKSGESFDYIVSRGVIEHVPDGIRECANATFAMRLMFDVPYREPAGVNQHHCLSDITEKDFAPFAGCELLFEENSGTIYYAPAKEPWPNMILCALSREGLKPLKTMFSYPIAPWRPSVWNMLKHKLLRAA